MVELLLAQGAAANTHDTWRRETPLHAAAQRGHEDIAQLLITRGADMEARDAFGRTPLHIAAWEDRAGVAAVLLARGAQVDADTRSDNPNHGMTALHYAAHRGCRKTAEVLLKHGAQVNAVTYNKETPLDIARQEKRDRMVDLLTAAGGQHGHQLNAEP
jgi:cytohesin